jgi:hypothetical protein
MQFGGDSPGRLLSLIRLRGGATCDISIGNAVLQDGVVTECGPGGGGTSVSSLTIVGATTEHTVEISGTGGISVLLSNADIRGGQPFVIDGSSVDIWVEGANKVIATSSGRAGVDCRGGSGVNFFGLAGGALSAQGWGRAWHRCG